MHAIVRLVRLVWDKLAKYAWKFAIVGGVGYVIDVGLFNALRLGTFGSGHFLQGPIGAKIVSVAVATIATWFGNRYWTFRHTRRSDYLLELLEFILVSIAGLLISVACLWVSHYLLGFRSLAADNISTNVVGFVLATTFRFLLYRFWVFSHGRKGGIHHQKARDAAALNDAAAHRSGEHAPAHDAPRAD